MVEKYSMPLHTPSQFHVLSSLQSLQEYLHQSNWETQQMEAWLIVFLMVQT